MIYSRWDPATGNYDYYEALDRIGLNDDLPIPALPLATKLGVPSVECGRPLPRGARHIGSGESARGSIVPPASVQLAASLTGTLAPWLGNPWVMLTAGLVVGAGVVHFYYKSRRGRP